MLWLYNLCVIGVYSLAWGGGLAFALQLPRDDRGLRPRRAVLALACGSPVLMLRCRRGAVRAQWPALVRSRVRRHDRAGSGDAGNGRGARRRDISAQPGSADPKSAAMDRRRRHRGGGARPRRVASAGADHRLPTAATGGDRLVRAAVRGGPRRRIARHRLFDIERLANRSLVYIALVAILVAGYATLVAVLVSGLRLSGTVAAAIAAAAAPWHSRRCATLRSAL